MINDISFTITHKSKMALYSYQAFSKDGKRLTGHLEAASMQVARDQLSKQGLYPVSVLLKPQEQLTGGFLQRLFQSPMTLKDKIFFTNQLSVLLKSGIALPDALRLMIEQSPKNLRPMITRLCEELKEGASFTHALSLYPASFPPLYVQLVKAGEASGQMEKVLARLAVFLAEQDEFNKSVSAAIRGPLIQLGLVFVVAGFLLTLIVPKIAEVFKSMGGKSLPMITRVVLKISDVLVHNYIRVGIVLGIVFVLYQIWSHSTSGRLTIDKLKLKLPLIKYFTRTQAVVQFTQTLGLLLESGVNIAEALDIVVQIVDNQILVTALKKARDSIIKQGKVTEYLQRTGLFSNVSIHLIGTGEQSGALDVMLIQVGNYNQEELQEYARGMTALLNPLSMLILAGVVGTIIFAVMAPLLNMSSMMGG